MKNILLPLLAIALLAACMPAQTPTPQPTLIDVAPQSDPAQPQPAEPEGQTGECPPDAALMETLQAALPYEQAVIAPLAYGGESSLVVWFASPALDSESPEKAEAAAISLAVQAAKNLQAASPCLDAYNSLSFNVTDSSYWLWFSGSIRVADIAGLSINEAASGGGSGEPQGGGRQSTQSESGSCTWAEAASKLQDTFAAPENIAVFYYTLDTGGSHVYAHWRASAAPDSAQMEETMKTLTAELGCLNPIPNDLSATLTNEGGTLLATAYLPLNEKGKPRVKQFTYTIMEDSN